MLVSNCDPRFICDKAPGKTGVVSLSALCQPRHCCMSNSDAVLLSLSASAYASASPYAYNDFGCIHLTLHAHAACRSMIRMRQRLPVMALLCRISFWASESLGLTKFILCPSLKRCRDRDQQLWPVLLWQASPAALASDGLGRVSYVAFQCRRHGICLL